MQDKIVGPLTMLQFVYAVIGFGLCYVIAMSIPKPLSYVLIVPIAAFVLCLDFLKVNERPFLDFFKAAIAYFGSPRQRVWHQGEDTDFEIEVYHVAKDNGPKVVSKGISQEDIRAIAQKNDRGEELIKR